MANDAVDKCGRKGQGAGRDGALLAGWLLAVHLVEVVLLRDDVQNFWRVLPVVRGVSLANVLNPKKNVNLRIENNYHHHHHHHHTTTTTTTTATVLQPRSSLEHPDHFVGAIVHVLEVPARARVTFMHKQTTATASQGERTSQLRN
jgi:hypothetical protein